MNSGGCSCCVQIVRSTRNRICLLLDFFCGVWLFFPQSVWSKISMALNSVSSIIGRNVSWKIRCSITCVDGLSCAWVCRKSSTVGSISLFFMARCRDHFVPFKRNLFIYSKLTIVGPLALTRNRWNNTVGCRILNYWAMISSKINLFEGRFCRFGVRHTWVQYLLWQSASVIFRDLLFLFFGRHVPGSWC